MTPHEKERLRWRKSALGSDCAQECITLGMTQGLEVIVYKTDENGKWVWAISTPKGFWLDARSSQEDALFLCAAMGWDPSDEGLRNV